MCMIKKMWVNPTRRAGYPLFRRRLVINPTPAHDLLKLELPGAWESPGSSGPLPFGKGKETQLGIPYGNQVGAE
jgi:hypothetical protein